MIEVTTDGKLAIIESFFEAIQLDAELPTDEATIEYLHRLAVQYFQF